MVSAIFVVTVNDRTMKSVRDIEARIEEEDGEDYITLQQGGLEGEVVYVHDADQAKALIEAITGLAAVLKWPLE